ncbi:hypothetical protein C8R44DRAFT_883311 [Mycena epipterygia]|nr:hypothetical protein C8R44DRAFT_883311 [Mycena epipterygia]
MMDEVAIEEQAYYFPHANKVGGLCQKHTATTPLTLTHESALNIVEALRRGDIHFGTEMAFKETADNMKSLFDCIMRIWDEEGKNAIGDIWDFSTDGNKLRCKAGYALFV